MIGTETVDDIALTELLRHGDDTFEHGTGIDSGGFLLPLSSHTTTGTADDAIVLDMCD